VAASAAAASVAKPSGIATALVHAEFVLTGVITTMLGPLLPILSLRWALSDRQAGYLFTAQFATSTLGVMVSTVMIRKHGYRVALLQGLTLMAAGAVLLAEASWGLGVISACLFGAGMGVTIPASNLLISDLNSTRRASALNLLNFSWGVGAVGCPFVVAMLQPAHQTVWLLYATALLLVVIASLIAAVRFPADLHEGKPAAAPVGSNPWKSPFIVILGALFFIYVGTENSVGGWVASYARRLETGSARVWAMTPSVFWGALLLGRALAPIFLTKVSETTLASASLALATGGVTVLLAGRSMSGVLLGAGMAGLGLSCIFPINIAMLSHRFAEMASRVGGLMFAVAGLGGATLPWLVGALSTRFGSLQIGLFVPLAGTAIMLLLYVSNAVSNNRVAPSGPSGISPTA
jgi:MFS transporter, FHS family, glucose/mannose:H+ symporter